MAVIAVLLNRITFITMTGMQLDQPRPLGFPVDDQ